MNMPLNINFLDRNQKRLKEKRIFLVLKIIGVAVLALAIITALADRTNPDERLNAGWGEVPLVKRVNQLIRSADRSLLGEREDRTNILLLGMGGAGHEGPYLTDTIILASIQHSTGEVSLISIPRDMAAPIPGHGWYKINSANAFGETKEAGQGGELVRQVLSEVFAVPIQYYVRVDFDGFTQLIDELGGLDVYVEKSFSDDQYPTGVNGEVMTVSFSQGWKRMGGEETLRFARSRHGSNGESGDFARARRQQKILEAAKGKVLSLGTLASPAKIGAVLETLSDHVRTNFSPWELIAVSRLTNNLESADIITYVLDDGPGGFLEPTLGIDGAYLLVPKNNSWQPLRHFVSTIFDQAALATTEPPPPPVRVEIQNGTSLPGLAARTTTLLDSQKFEVVRIGNAETRNNERTVIYDLSEGKYPGAAKELSELLGAEMVTEAPETILDADVDFLIILGTDLFRI